MLSISTYIRRFIIYITRHLPVMFDLEICSALDLNISEKCYQLVMSVYFSLETQ
jgi:hypothetical protein